MFTTPSTTSPYLNLDWIPFQQCYSQKGKRQMTREECLVELNLDSWDQVSTKPPIEQWDAPIDLGWMNEQIEVFKSATYNLPGSHYVYVLKLKNGRYVGESTNVEKRLAYHLHDAFYKRNDFNLYAKDGRNHHPWTKEHWSPLITCRATPIFRTAMLKNTLVDVALLEVETALEAQTKEAIGIAVYANNDKFKLFNPSQNYIKWN